MNEKMFTAEIEEYIKSVKSLASIDNFYDYEKKFASFHRELGKKILEKSLEHEFETGRKKKSVPNSGR